MEAESPWYVCTWACYSATLRWDRFGRRWAGPPSSRPPPFTSLNIHPLGVLHPFVHLLRTLAKYPQFVSNSLVISFSLLSFSSSFLFSSRHPTPRVTLLLLLLLRPSTSPLRRVAFLLAGWKGRFLVTLTCGISDLLSTPTCRISDCRGGCLLCNPNFFARAVPGRFV